MAMAETNLFAPYKALGLICSSVRPAYAPPPPGRDHLHDGHVCCVLDNLVVGYRIGRRLFPEFTTNPMEDGEIAMLAADPFRQYVGFANKAAVGIIRNRMLEHLLFFDGAGGPKLLLSMTEILLVVDKANTIHVFNVEDGQPMVHLASPESFDITVIAHPITYLNKVLVGASDGRMRLWNFRTGRMVHEFPVSDEFNAPILVLEQSPAIDVIGVGMADGRIHMRNIKFDKVICTFRQSGEITALAFRTDGVETLVSANSEGTLVVWDLNERQLLVQLPRAHSARIHSLHFMSGQPFLLSAGEDNKIVKWFFRNENSVPEVNSTLEGHSEPANALRFCNEEQIVSASRDGHVRRFETEMVNRCKSFGLAREVHKKDLSKDRFMDVRLNPIVQIEISRGREAVWDNMICRHEESPLVSTWSTRLGKRGSHLFCHERFSKNPTLLEAVATSVFISCCGTFALVGYSSGHVDVWNMQSGLYKFSLKCANANGKRPKNGKKKMINNKNKSPMVAHAGAAVTGLALDLLNRNAVSGASDGTIHFWNFRSPFPVLRSQLRVDQPIGLFRLDHMDSLLAVALKNGEVGVLDVLCRRVARRLFHSACIDWTPESCITALEFSNDGKWLLSSDNLGFLKVWDLPSGSLIDVMRFVHPCIGMSFGERGNYLATCHQGQRGVYLWANKTLFIPEPLMANRSESELHNNLSTLTDLPMASSSAQEEQMNEKQNEEEEEETGTKEEEEEETVVGDEDEATEEGRETRVVLIDEDEEEDEEGASLSNISSSCVELPDREQLAPSLFTLSGLAPAQWASLPYLDLIRQRNKPVEPPKKPTLAPFFLPTTSTLTGFEFDEGKKGKNEEDEEADKDGRTKVMEVGEGTSGMEEQQEERRRPMAKGTGRRTARRDEGQMHSVWTSKLMSASTNEELCAAFAQLKGLSLSTLDFQIRALSGPIQLAKFVEMLAAQLETRRDFDLVQSWMAAFLNIHHHALWGDQKERKEMDEEEEDEEKLKRSREEEEGQQMLTSQLEKLSVLQRQAHDVLQPLFDDNTAVSEFLKSALL